MSEINPIDEPLDHTLYKRSRRIVRTVEIVTFGLGGATMGWAITDIPLLLSHPAEVQEHVGLSNKKDEAQSRLTKDQEALDQVQTIADEGVEGVDYTKLQTRVSAEETQVATLENTHLRYDDLYPDFCAATVGVGVLSGVIYALWRNRS